MSTGETKVPLRVQCTQVTPPTTAGPLSGQCPAPATQGTQWRPRFLSGPGWGAYPSERAYPPPDRGGHAARAGRARECPCPEPHRAALAEAGGPLTRRHPRVPWRPSPVTARPSGRTTTCRPSHRAAHPTPWPLPRPASPGSWHPRYCRKGYTLAALAAACAVQRSASPTTPQTPRRS